jgi:hypothetical protein
MEVFMLTIRMFSGTRMLIVALAALGCTSFLYPAAKNPAVQKPEATAQATPATHTQTGIQAAQTAAQNFADFLAPAASKLTALKDQATQKALEAVTPVLQSALASATANLANNGAGSAADSSGNNTAGQTSSHNSGQTTQADTQINNKPKKNGFKQFFKTHKKRWQNATVQGVKAFIKNTRIAKATNESLKAFLQNWKDANPEQQQEFFSELLTALDQEIKDGPVRDAIDEIKDVAWYARYRRQLVAASFVGGMVAGFCIRSVIWRKK